MAEKDQDQMIADIVKFEDYKPILHEAISKIVQKSLQDQQNITETQSENSPHKISEEILNFATKKNKNFQYIIKCMILKKGDCGLNISGTCYWDDDMDGELHVQEIFDSFVCIVYVYGLGL